ncbi:MAG: hypothetical protein MJK18_06680 [Bdellovibrionales bacterium]|nr:hypothetical protein [Bdellovibrionales bacterium]
MACIWRQNEEHPYWSSTNVPICFMSTDTERQQHAMNLIRNAFTEINNRTPFRVTGFETCDDNPAGREQVRINLNESLSGGQAFFAERTSSGRNIELGIGLQPNGQPVPDQYIQAQALHELLHMFGIEHNTHRDDKDFQPGRLLASGEYWALGDYDPQSVMVRGVGDRMNETYEAGNFLTNLDVQCLNIIAGGDFPGHPQIINAAQAYREPAPAQLLEVEETPIHQVQ